MGIGIPASVNPVLFNAVAKLLTRKCLSPEWALAHVIAGNFIAFSVAALIKPAG